ncbi:uncharacterized protein LOC114711485 [Neltuma alba]|uniref:uncharacterized protein LOC114711485 n=1 Tax=Neltuma alba TaxID=207710 RepID=UPI0010A2BFE0|nr:uncharacterized protein LOC114711485 [Prosopis alba]
MHTEKEVANGLGNNITKEEEAWLCECEGAKMSSKNLDSRSLIQGLRSFDNEVPLFDFGHPLLNRVSNSFLKAAAIGAIQAMSREAYFTAVEGASLDNGGSIVPDVSDAKRARFPAEQPEATTVEPKAHSITADQALKISETSTTTTALIPATVTILLTTTTPPAATLFTSVALHMATATEAL